MCLTEDDPAAVECDVFDHVVGVDDIDGTSGDRPGPRDVEIDPSAPVGVAIDPSGKRRRATTDVQTDRPTGAPHCDLESPRADRRYGVVQDETAGRECSAYETHGADSTAAAAGREAVLNCS